MLKHLQIAVLVHNRDEVFEGGGRQLSLCLGLYDAWVGCGLLDAVPAFQQMFNLIRDE